MTNSNNLLSHIKITIFSICMLSVETYFWKTSRLQCQMKKRYDCHPVLIPVIAQDDFQVKIRQRQSLRMNNNFPPFSSFRLTLLVFPLSEVHLERRLTVMTWSLPCFCNTALSLFYIFGQTSWWISNERTENLWEIYHWEDLPWITETWHQIMESH